MSTATKDEHETAHDHHEGHHVPAAWIFHAVFGALLVLTALTYLASTVHMGRSINIIVAMLIATVKASLVCYFFMHLRWDKKFNTVILLVSVGFLALFLGIATLDATENEWRKDPGYAERKMAAAREAQNISYHHAAAEEGGHSGTETGSAEQEKLRPLAEWAKGAFGTLPKVADSPANPVTDAKVKLGQMLYFDARLSKNHDISCNSCHLLDKFGVDGQPTSPGHKGQLGARNSPTTLNAAFQAIGQFWDARAESVEEQAKGPILNTVEMGMPDEGYVLKVLHSIPDYKPLFDAAFLTGPEATGDSITYDNVAKAIGAFERKLVTPGRFDAFMEGKLDALTPEEIKGLEVFRTVNCTQCHGGLVLGGQSIEKLGKLKPYPTTDKGVAEETKRTRDEFMFKVPQLRNVSKTGPYFHDGSIGTLEEAIRLMGEYQLGLELSDEQVRELSAFLGALEGELDPALAAKPQLPASGPTTPAPDPN